MAVDRSAATNRSRKSEATSEPYAETTSGGRVLNPDPSIAGDTQSDTSIHSSSEKEKAARLCGEATLLVNMK